MVAAAAALEVEVGDGGPTATRTAVFLIKQVDEFPASSGVKVLIDDCPTFVLVQGLVAIGLTLITSDNHHVGDEGLRPNALRKGKESDDKDKGFSYRIHGRQKYKIYLKPKHLCVHFKILPQASG